MIKAGKQLLYKLFVEFTGEGNGGGIKTEKQLCLQNTVTTGQREGNYISWLGAGMDIKRLMSWDNGNNMKITESEGK